MKLGFFTMPIHFLDRNYAETLKEDREAFILADELGFSEAYCGEHITDMAETITSSAMFLSSLVHATKQIRLGTGTVNMPNTHPAQVAAQIAMLDHMLEGRFIFGISPGGLLSDAEALGNLDANRTEMFNEAIDQVLKIWTGEAPYNLKGKYWTVSTERTLVSAIGQGIIQKPYQKPYPPIMITAVSPYSKSVENAGVQGWDFISANFLMPNLVATHWPTYEKGCAQSGHTADRKNWRVAKSIFVADDLDTARRYVFDEGSPYRFYYKQLVTKLVGNGRPNLFKRHPDMKDEDITIDYVLDELVIWGTPDKVAEDLMKFREESGDFGTLLYAGKDWKDKALGKRSMVLMAEKVMPLVNSML
ncbi:MAG: LLM class flavin-dependent oxidoreductase [Hyphomicrobiales bacterium]|nr:LLM class flavin-dependent oxidoreductase [Hyphomicrobiales bacterium]